MLSVLVCTKCCTLGIIVLRDHLTCLVPPPLTLYQGNEAHGVLARNLIVKMAGSGLGEGHMGKTYGQSTKLPNRELGPWEGL